MRATDWAREHPLWTVFAAALALRLAHVVLVWAVAGRAGFLIEDSSMYLGLGQRMAEGADGLGLVPDRMPLYTAFVALHHLIAGAGASVLLTITQSVVDAGTCVVAALIGRRIAPALTLPAGLAAAAIPTMIVVSGMVLTDTLFTAFAALSLLAAVRWLDVADWRSALMLGVALALAALTRLVVVPWGFALLAVLLGLALWRGPALRAAAPRLAAAGLILAAPLLATAAYNQATWGNFALNAQSGTHLLRWIVPLAMEATDGTPHAQGAQAMNRLAHERIPELEQMGPFERSRAEAALAIERLGELGPVPIAKAWAIGAAINLGAPAATQSPVVAALPRTGFFDTPGDTKLDKVWNFLFANDNPLYGWLLLVGLVGVGLARLTQAAGFAAGWRRHPRARLALLGLLAWLVYLLAVSGPVAAPKYRLPAEPALAVFLALAWDGLRRRRPDGGPTDRPAPQL